MGLLVDFRNLWLCIVAGGVVLCGFGDSSIVYICGFWFVIPGLDRLCIRCEFDDVGCSLVLWLLWVLFDVGSCWLGFVLR